MSRELAIIREITRQPIIDAYNAISPFIQLRRRDTDGVVERLFSINVQTGEAQFAVLNAAGGIKMEDDKAVLETVILDLNLYYLDFKTK